MNPTSFSDVFIYLQSLMTTHEAIFVAAGLALYKSLVVIMWVWFGIQVALRGEGFPMEKFMDLLMSTAIGFAMLRFYSSSLWGFGGRSFSRLVIDQGAYLADFLNRSQMDQVANRMGALFMGLETPGIGALLNAGDLFRWIFTGGALTVAYAFMFAVISLGYFAAAYGVLIGPIFIPFFIIPSMNHMFWNWLRALIQYSFYQVTGNAYIFVFGSLLIGYVDRSGTDLNGMNHAKSWFPLLCLLISFTYGLLKIPSINNSYFSGKSGESAHPW